MFSGTLNGTVSGNLNKRGNARPRETARCNVRAAIVVIIVPLPEEGRWFGRQLFAVAACRSRHGEMAGVSAISPILACVYHGSDACMRSGRETKNVKKKERRNARSANGSSSHVPLQLIRQIFTLLLVMHSPKVHGIKRAMRSGPWYSHEAPYVLVFSIVPLFLYSYIRLYSKKPCCFACCVNIPHIVY